MLGLVGIGKIIEKPGTVINGALDLSEGNIGKVVTNGATGYLLGGLGNKVKSMESAGKFSKESSGILQFIIDAYDKTLNTIVDAVSDNNNEKKR